jgi:hypothetical protein
MADIKVRLGSENSVKVISSVAGDTTLSDLRDVDFSGGLINGMLLQYSSTAQKWGGSLNIIPNSIDINQGTITSNTPFFSATSTWNNPTTSFIGLKLNITNVSSANTSKLVDFQLGGNTVFNITSSGISSFINSVYFYSSIFLTPGYSGISTRGIGYFMSTGRLVSTNSPEVGYATTSNYILTTDSSDVPVWTSVIDGGQY